MALAARLVKRVGNWILAHPTTHWSNNWGETLQLYGLVQAGRAFGQPQYAEYVRRWLDERLGQGLHVSPAANSIDAEAYRASRLMYITGYCGSWGANLIIPALEAPGEAAVGLQERLANYILHEAVRDADGGLKHGPMPHHETYWVDTIYYSVPGLAFHGRKSGDARYLAEGARQLQIHTERLRDPATGLFYHAWNARRQWVSPELWGRGNGWILMSAAEWLTHAPADDPNHGFVAQLFAAMAETLCRLQTPDGMWRTVLDRADTYEEVSATAMFAFGLARGHRLGLLGTRASEAAVRAAEALSAHVADDGAVTGVSAGTGPGDAAHYRARPVGTYTWGTGAWLLAAAEVAPAATPIRCTPQPLAEALHA